MSSYEDKICYKQNGIDSFACGHYNINTIMRNNNVNIICIIITYIITNLSEEDKAKLDVIEAVFYDDEYGYVSKVNTLKHARQINKNITMGEINKLMNRVSFRSKKGYSDYNSFIANFPRDEYTVDIAEMRYLNGKYMYIFICICLFSKYAYGIEMPIKNYSPTAIILRDVLNKMGIPKAIASDDGGKKSRKI